MLKSPFSSNNKDEAKILPKLKVCGSFIKWLEISYCYKLELCLQRSFHFTLKWDGHRRKVTSWAKTCSPTILRDLRILFPILKMLLLENVKSHDLPNEIGVWYKQYRNREKPISGSLQKKIRFGELTYVWLRSLDMYCLIL